MGFLKHIGKRLMKGHHIGKRILKGASIGLRKVGHTVQKVSSYAAKAGPLLAMTGDPRLAAIGASLSAGSVIGNAAGSVSASAGTALGHLEKGEYADAIKTEKNTLELGKKLKQQVDNFKS